MDLNREPKVITTSARALGAGIAVLAATGIVASTVALAGHYDEEFLRVSRLQAADTAAQSSAPQDGSTEHATLSLSHAQAKPGSHGLAAATESPCDSPTRYAG